jgi:hypothetical protein
MRGVGVSRMDWDRVRRDRRAARKMDRNPGEFTASSAGTSPVSFKPPTARQLCELDRQSRRVRGTPFVMPRGFTREGAADLIVRLKRL